MKSNLKKLKAALDRIPVMDELNAAWLRQMSPWQRLDLANEMWKLGRELVYAQLKNQYKDWGNYELIEEMVRRISTAPVLRFPIGRPISPAHSSSPRPA
jgi:hypothetical protein